jgi:Protein of unknown function (DUF3990)
MPWGTRLLTVYHGTVGPYANDIEQNGIQLGKCAPQSDFARGFYTTRILRQAIEFANERYRQVTKDHASFPSVYPDPQHAAVLEFSIVLDALGGLDTLAFVQPTDDWLAFITYCRTPSIPSRAHKSRVRFYDAVYGPVWAVGADAVGGWEQLSFHTDYPVSTLLKLQNPIRRGSPEIP